MKVKDLLIHAQKSLKEAGIATARLDTLLLLEDATEKDRAWLLAHEDYELDNSTVQKLTKQIQRRSKHEPLSYIRGKSEFYGREFAVNAHTLQPRPETETMIELLQELVASHQSSVASQKKETQEIPTRSHGSTTRDKRQMTSDNDPTIMERLHGSDVVQGEAEQQTESYQAYDEGAAEASTQQRAERTVSASSLADWQDNSAMTIVDVGTGSGCIAITAKLIYPKVSVVATDIDNQCLKLARQNAKTHNADVTFLKGNLLKPLTSLRTGSTYAEPETDLFLSSGVNRINDTVHEQRKEKSGSGPQANNRVVSSADKQIGDTWILLANLPYVPDDHTINQAATYEPKHAIFGGPDGLDYYRELFQQTTNLAQIPAYIFTEALPPQHETLSAIAEKHGYTQINQNDFIQVFAPKTDKKTL